MRTVCLFFILLLSVNPLYSESRTSLLNKLDDAIEKRPLVLQRKEFRIDSLKRVFHLADSPSKKQQLLNRMYEEYLTYNFDSTMVYVELAERMARQAGDDKDVTRSHIHKSLALATSGHFSQAVDILRSVDSASLTTDMLKEYYSVCEWTYGVWAEYSNDRTYAPDYKRQSLAYLDSLISIIPDGVREKNYRIAERHLRSGDYSTARDYYLKALEHLPQNTRLYAQAAYALALTYRGMGNDDKYFEWLVNAAISDQITPLKENLASQQLAIYLRSEKGDLERANKYLRIALEDAIFYNNRLRMLEIAEKFPQITMDYQDIIALHNHRLKLYILIIVILLAGTAVALWQMRRQIKKKRRAIEVRNELMAKLKDANHKLTDTNHLREQYTSLFMDLCAAYIEKLNRFPMVLKLKVRNMGDLNSVADRYVRPSEGEMREMFFNFDSAFLKLYPDFIAQFNTLLQPDKQILPKDKELLNTDLRIYALIRMGITDSNKIASLLFFSPQTIFNHRTSVRNRAIDRDTFEKNVLTLCDTIPLSGK